MTPLDEIAHQPVTFGQDLAALVPRPPLVERSDGRSRCRGSIQLGITAAHTYREEDATGRLSYQFRRGSCVGSWFVLPALAKAMLLVPPRHDYSSNGSSVQISCKPTANQNSCWCLAKECCHVPVPGTPMHKQANILQSVCVLRIPRSMWAEQAHHGVLRSYCCSAA